MRYCSHSVLSQLSQLSQARGRKMNAESSEDRGASPARDDTFARLAALWERSPQLFDAVRSYEPDAHGGMIPLIYLAAVPYLDHPNRAQLFIQLLHRVLGAMVEQELFAIHEHTQIPFPEYAAMLKFAPGVVNHAASSGAWLVPLQDGLNWFAVRKYPFADRVRAHFDQRHAAFKATGNDDRPFGTRERTTHLNTIGALRAIIAGEFPGVPPHPWYLSDAKMIAAIESWAGGMPGLSKSSLEKHFAAAKRSLKQP
jgi:hypothetical protein